MLFKNRDFRKQYDINVFASQYSIRKILLRAQNIPLHRIFLNVFVETFTHRVTSDVKDNREEMYDAIIIKCSALEGGWTLKHEYTV